PLATRPGGLSARPRRRRRLAAPRGGAGARGRRRRAGRRQRQRPGGGRGVTTTAERRPRRHYARGGAGGAFFIPLAAAGVRAAPGVLIVPLERAFGWSRATISAAVSVNLLLYGLIGPFAAALVESLGVRRTIAGALALAAGGAALTTFITAPW